MAKQSLREVPSRWSDVEVTGEWSEETAHVCSLHKPLHIYLPPGKTVKIPCSVHGEHTLRGNNVRYS